MLLNQLTFHAPTSVKELMKLLSQLDNVRLQAGGTFLLNALKLLKRNGAKTPDHIISLQKISELKGIHYHDHELTIKSMTTIDDILNHPLIGDHLPVLLKVCQNISTQPIRNMATIGGNLTCRYTWTEMPAVCMGLGAKLHFIDGDLKEEIIDTEEFFKNAAKTDKILTKITFTVDDDSLISYHRVKKSQFVDIPMLSLMITTKINGSTFTKTRVAVNNCVEFAQRDEALEQYLNSQSIRPDLPQQALDHLSENIYDKRSNDYKKYMFRLSIKKSLEELIDQTT